MFGLKMLYLSHIFCPSVLLGESLLSRFCATIGWVSTAILASSLLQELLWSAWSLPSALSAGNWERFSAGISSLWSITPPDQRRKDQNPKLAAETALIAVADATRQPPIRLACGSSNLLHTKDGSCVLCEGNPLN
jgi:hypothetical protein